MILEWNHYYKTTYKYSGGKDKNALNNTIYSDELKAYVNNRRRNN